MHPSKGTPRGSIREQLEALGFKSTMPIKRYKQPFITVRLMPPQSKYAARLMADCIAAGINTQMHLGTAAL